MAATYKLFYFNIRARAEPIRLTFHYAGVPFEDVRVDRDDWLKLKPTMPYGQMPVLEVDGQQIPQSLAIARFLGKRFGLAGKSDVEAALLDSIADLQNDFRAQVINFVLVARGRRQGDKDKIFKEEALPAAETHFPRLEKLLTQAGSGFFGKSGVSWVDFYIADSLHVWLEEEVVGKEVCDLLNKYPELKAFVKRVHELPQLQSYLKVRA